MRRTSRKRRYERCVMHLKGQSGYNPYAVCHASVYGREYAKNVRRGTLIEHHEHPEFSLGTARKIAMDHLKKDKNYYGSKKGGGGEAYLSNPYV